MKNSIDVPSPQPAEPDRRTHPDSPDPAITPSPIPRPGVPVPEITNPPGDPQPGPHGPDIVPPGTPFIP